MLKIHSCLFWNIFIKMFSTKSAHQLVSPPKSLDTQPFSQGLFTRCTLKTSKLTEGKIFNKLILFSLPMIAGNMLQQVYNLVDTFVVGIFIGAGALAAVESAYTLMFFITSVIIVLCMGSVAYFSTDFGGGRKQELRQDIWLYGKTFNGDFHRCRRG